MLPHQPQQDYTVEQELAWIAAVKHHEGWIHPKDKKPTEQKTGFTKSFIC